MRPKLSGTATRAIRRCLVGPGQEFAFSAPGEDFTAPAVQECGLYIHIPFCRGACAYCPYNKVAYDPALAGPYRDALLREIESYQRLLGRVRITSVYIGGGTPTTMLAELGPLLEAVRRSFDLTGPVCIETNPSDLNGDTAGKLRAYGVDLVSVGVQSFNDANLRFLGRRYSGVELERSLELVMAAGFKSVNLDLMFAIPGQSQAALESDIFLALASGANQLTFYPLFTFPYSAAGKHLETSRVIMPRFAARRKMYRMIHASCLERGMERVSVWSFRRGPGPRYSSVTRDFYIGLGAGAGSHLDGCFYFNTFSVSDYMDRSSTGRLPVALKMEMNGSLSRLYWLYWRLYETSVSLEEADNIFTDRNMRLFRTFTALCRLTGFGSVGRERFALTEKGAFWLHLAQNYFALDYVNKIWTAAGREPWPDRVTI